jgi:hypothetical protein
VWENFLWVFQRFRIWWVSMDTHSVLLIPVGLVFLAPFWWEFLLPDHVEKPRLWWQWKALDEGMCQVNLSCLVSQDDNVNYTWYRGSEVISTLRNLTFVEKQIDANGQYTYTCNASNAVSWKSSNLTQGCPRDPLSKWSIPQPGLCAREIWMWDPLASSPSAL